VSALALRDGDRDRLPVLTGSSAVRAGWRSGPGSCCWPRTFRSVRDLTTTIRAFTDGRNDRRHPFTWTKTADQILTKADRQKTSETPH
jgi:hypothetical protein